MLTDHSQTPHSTPVFRRPTAIMWCLAAIATGAALALLGVPHVAYTDLINAGVIIGLLLLSSRATIEPQDDNMLTPAPALLIAGLSIVGWPLLPIAVLIGTLAAGALRRRAFDQTLSEAALRWLTVALIAPVYRLTQPVSGLPYSTPTALAGVSGTVEWDYPDA